MLLNLEDITFGYRPDQLIFDHFNLQIEKHQVTALIGESGCGKTTLLSLIYGLYDWQHGRMFFDGHEVFGPKKNLVPGEAEMKMVAQHYDLMPYSKVYDNVGKFISNIDREAKKQKVEELLDVVGLQEYVNEYPKNLSGGQKQRVAIAQALSKTPKLLLLDEPFSGLDFSLRTAIRDKLFDYVRKNEIGLIMSTHDVTQIMPWTDEVIIMHGGKIIQRDAPAQVYNNPRNPYVARLFGEVNIFSEEERQNLQLSKWAYYPHEIIADGQGVSAEVLQSRFSGNHYRNLIELGKKKIITYSEKEISGQVKLRFI